MDGGAWQATVHGVARAGNDLATKPRVTSTQISEQTEASLWGLRCHRPCPGPGKPAPASGSISGRRLLHVLNANAVVCCVPSVPGFFLLFGGFAHTVTRPGGLLILTAKRYWLLFGKYSVIDCMVPVLMGVWAVFCCGCSVCSVFLVDILVWFLWTYRYLSAGKVLRSKTRILGMCVVSFHNYCQSSKIMYQLPQFWYWDLLFKGCLVSFKKIFCINI